ncbi:hypothetical protein OG763_33945 [Streptomyces sp. NBC_01230]|uniref:hypothetical protein n=1 Tax=unclassified Streptomyces TaxID=2593676 RepID=UPI002E1016DA|nr:hypothetical protein OG763_33945 [Streptomyces sp. NBC_01230]
MTCADEVRNAITARAALPVVGTDGRRKGRTLVPYEHPAPDRDRYQSAGASA